MKIFVWTACFAACVAAGFFAVLYSGVVPIAATLPDPPGMDWVLFTGSEHSVKFHSRTIRPPDLTSSDMMQTGSGLYRGLCAGCHGAVGEKPSAIGLGLNPPPPLLALGKPAWTASQVFYFIKYGVKMTGMPAFGPVYADSSLWCLTAFVKKMPSLSPEEYKAMASEPAAQGNIQSDLGIGPVTHIVFGPASKSMALRGEKILKDKCLGCHAIPAPGPSGPALGGVAAVRTPEYIMNMILNPIGMEEKDPFVRKLVKDFGGLTMPLRGLDSARARDVVEYLRTTRSPL